MHYFGKFDSLIWRILTKQELQPEMQHSNGLGKFVSGILLIIGGLTRIVTSILSIVILGTIFVVKWKINKMQNKNYTVKHIQIILQRIRITLKNVPMV